MCEAEALRFREPKQILVEDLVDKAILTSTKYKNKWAVTIFNEWQTAPKVQVPVLDSGGMFEDCWSTVNSNRRYGCIAFELLAE